MNEMVSIAEFIKSTHPSDSIFEMEENLGISIGYAQRIGELVNEAEYNYSVKKSEAMNKLLTIEEETETTRKTKLDAWVASDKKLWQDLKNLQRNLKSIQMSLMQAIKTRREEPR